MTCIQQYDAEFDPDFGYELDDIPFDELWSPPNGCSGNEIIRTEVLPKLPCLPKTLVKEEPVPEPEPVPQTPTPVIPHEQPNTIHFTYVPPRPYQCVAYVSTVTRWCSLDLTVLCAIAVFARRNSQLRE